VPQKRVKNGVFFGGSDFVGGTPKMTIFGTFWDPPKNPIFWDFYPARGFCHDVQKSKKCQKSSKNLVEPKARVPPTSPQSPKKLKKTHFFYKKKFFKKKIKKIFFQKFSRMPKRTHISA
jgi:hypothetical protein